MIDPDNQTEPHRGYLPWCVLLGLALTLATFLLTRSEQPPSRTKKDVRPVISLEPDVASPDMRVVPTRVEQNVAAVSEEAPAPEPLIESDEEIAADPPMPPSLGEALSQARHEVRELTESHAALPHNAGVRYFAANPGQDLTARFLADGVRIESGQSGKTWKAELRLADSAGATVAKVGNGRVEYAHAGGVITEYFENRSDGIEQGFVLHERPEGGALVAIALGGDLRAEADPDSPGDLRFVDASGEPVLSYRDLKVWDANEVPLDASMQATNSGVLLAVNDAGAAYPVTIDPLIASQEAKLVADDGEQTDEFGHSVSVDGDTAVVGTYQDDTGAGTDAGSAYVFKRSGSSWTQEAKLEADDAAHHDAFGYSVSLSGDTALIGAHEDDTGDGANAGSAYVFKRSGTNWAQEAKLEADDATPTDWFGYSVSLMGDTAVIGAILGDTAAGSNVGSAYVFRRSGTVWTQEAKLEANDAAPSDFFGYSVSLSGDTALVGAYFDDLGASTNAGSAYVFTRSGTVWAQEAKLEANDAAPNDRFGNSVSLSGDTALIGAALDDTGAGANAGSAYVFKRSGTMWTQEARLEAADAASSDEFGNSVSLSGDTVLVGAFNHDTGAGTDAGSAYVFKRSGTSWVQEAKLEADDAAQLDRFGTSVSLSGDTALIGAYHDNSRVGSAYVFLLTPPPPPPTCTEDQKILNPSTNSPGSDWFGSKLDMDGPRAIIGAQRSGVSGGGTTAGPGAAYIYEQDPNGRWVPAKDSGGDDVVLLDQDGDHDDRFGSDVAIEGDIAVVSAIKRDSVSPAHEQAGEVHVFQRQANGDWDPVKSFHSPSPQSSEHFGSSVDLSGDTLVVGATLGGVPDGGRAYVYERHVGGTNAWGHVKTLVASVVGEEFFGAAVGIEGDTIAVTSLGWLSTTGRLFVYARNEGGSENWGEVANVTPADVGNDEDFGSSVTISGDLIAVGADDKAVDGLASAGAVYVFKRDSDDNGSVDWLDVAKVISPDASEGDGFGYAVSMDERNLLVGANGVDIGMATSTGAAYVFRQESADATSWSVYKRWEQSDPNPNDTFGSYVAISGCNLLASAHGDDEVASGAGAVYSLLLPVYEDQLFRGTAADDRFGSGIDIDGDLAVVGDTRSGGAEVGLTLYQRNPGTGLWAYVKVIDTITQGAFVTQQLCVDLNGDRLIVGVFSENSEDGAAYIYERNVGGGDNWGRVERLADPGGAGLGQRFGWDVSIMDNRAVVSSLYFNGADGRVYLYERDGGGNWGPNPAHTFPAGNTNDLRGAAINISDDGKTVFASAYGGDHAVSGAGEVLVFQEDHPTPDDWGLRQTLYHQNPIQNDIMGQYMDLSGDDLLVSIQREIDGKDNAGAAVLFSRNSAGTYSQVREFRAPVPITNSRFSQRISMEGDLVLIGANFAPAAKAYIYHRHAGGLNQWGLVKTLAPLDDDINGDRFGVELAVNDHTAIISSPLDDTIAERSGTAHFYDLRKLDGDGDGLLDEVERSLGSDPDMVDSDGDSVEDGDEVNTHGTDPTLADTDGDGFDDGQEINQLGTDPLVYDDLSPPVITLNGVASFNAIKSFENFADGGSSHSVPLLATNGYIYATTRNGGRFGGGTIFRIKTDGTSYTLLHEFSLSGDQGTNPNGSLIQGSNGALYGATGGGSFFHGTLFKIDLDGSNFETIYTFEPFDGSSPNTLVEGSDGNLYGTTSGGGAESRGTIFRASLDGAEFVTIYTFTSTDGSAPVSALIEGTSGQFFGTTTSGGSENKGTVFRVDSSGAAFATLHSFDSDEMDGESPRAPLILSADGALYGTTARGGLSDSGTVFMIAPDGSQFETLHSFQGAPDGRIPEGGLIQGLDGMLYGTCAFGGSNNHGSVYKISVAGSVYETLYSFAGSDIRPLAGLAQRSDGILYGTTATSVVTLRVDGTNFASLHTFSNTNETGMGPVAGLILADDGRLVGTTGQGGEFGEGVIFKVGLDGGNFEKTHSFTDRPTGTLLKGADGAIYGNATGGSFFDGGAIFRQNADGSGFASIHSFGSGAGDGRYPVGALLERPIGTFFGVTASGGSWNRGTVFKINDDGGDYSRLYSFIPADGSDPTGIIEGIDGMLYGTTSSGGGSNRGTVFRVSKDGSNFQTLHVFSTADGQKPRGKLVQRDDGTLFGVTRHGGDHGRGTLFALDPDGTSFTNLSHFSDGSTPNGIVLASDGALYGTMFSGALGSSGGVFKFDPIGNSMNVIYSLKLIEGSSLHSELAVGGDGALYGTASLGGDFDSGTVFRVELPDPNEDLVIELECSSDDFVDPGATVVGDSRLQVNLQVGGDAVDLSTVGDYVISYNATDSAGNAAQEVSRTVSVSDNIGPVLIRVGNRQMNLVLGDEYVEQGAAAVDGCEGNVNVVVSGDSVNTSVPGVYTVKYDATDSHGNIGRTLRRTVVVSSGNDFGDGYAVATSLPNGAFHVASGPKLGTLRDSEVDGQPTADATGDDVAGDADEDGVTFTSGVLVAGESASVDVVVSEEAGALQAWVDFNGDGDWDDAGEQVFADESVVVGSNSLSYAVPASATVGDTLARFRLSTVAGLGVAGAASDGEVEDYEVTIDRDTDGDGLLDSEEATLGTNPSLADTDGDGIFDGNEVTLGTDPLDGDDPTPLVSELVHAFVETPPSDPELVTASGLAYFSRSNAGAWEVWVSDGTVSGTVLLKGGFVRVGSSDQERSGFVEVNGAVYFSADDGSGIGDELWKSDGTVAGTVLVKEINSDVNSDSNPQYLEALGNRLFLTATNTDPWPGSGEEVWVSDGTSAGTMLVKDINPGGTYSNPFDLTALGGTLFFEADDGSGHELWKSDGTEVGTVKVKTINGSGSSSISNLLATGNLLYFSASDGVNGKELWKSDGTEAGTVMVKDINLNGSSNPVQLTEVNGVLYFRATDGGNVSDHGDELWRSDGTAAGTVMVKNIRSGNSGSFPAELTDVNGVLFFTANGDDGARHVWKSDGTEAGTVKVAAVGTGVYATQPRDLMAVSGRLFFTVDDGVHGRELWKSDGTAAGTTLVENGYPGATGSDPRALRNLDGDLLYILDRAGEPQLRYLSVAIPPVALANSYSTLEDNVVSGNVITDDTGEGVDSEPNGGGLSANSTAAVDPLNGAVVIQSNGDFTYTPGADFNGSDSFTYELIGPQGTATAEVTITVMPVNDGPVFTLGADVSVLEDSGAQTVQTLVPGLDRLYWSHNSGGTDIQSANLDGGDVQSVLSTFDSNYDVEIDPVGKKVYWSESKHVKRSDLDGSNEETLIALTESAIPALSLDLGNGKIYFSSKEVASGSEMARWVNVMDLDGSNRQVLFAASATSNAVVEDLAYNAHDGMLYWALGNGVKEIGRASATGDGSDSVALISGLSLGTGGAKRLKVDGGGGKLYWTGEASGSAAIQRANLDGSAIETVVVDGSQVSTGLALDASVSPVRLYWIDPGSGGKIRTWADNGVGAQDVVSALGLTFSLHAPGLAVARNPNPGWAMGITSGPADEAGQTVTFQVTGNTNPSLFASGPALSADGILTFTPADDAFGSAEITVNLMDDGGTSDGGADISAEQTFTITVDPVNDPPTFTVGDDVVVGENSGAQRFGPSDDPGLNRLYWNNHVAGGIQGAALDGSGLATVVSTSDSSYDVEVDPVDGKLYWREGNALRRADLDGSNEEEVLTVLSGGIRSNALEVDVLNGLLYYVGAPVGGGNSRMIYVADLDGMNQHALFETVDGEHSVVSDLAVDAVNGMVYWTASNGVSAVSKASLFGDGSDQVQLFSGSSDTTGASVSPRQIEVDVASGKLYWTANDADSGINRANVDGTGRETLIDDVGLPLGFDLDRVHGKMVWTNGSGNGSIERADLDGSMREVVIGDLAIGGSFTALPGLAVAVDPTAPWTGGLTTGAGMEVGQGVTFTVTNDNAGLFAVAPSLSPSGTLTFTPAADAVGVATVTVTAMDDGGTGNGGTDVSAPQTFTITFTEQTDADGVADTVEDAVPNASGTGTGDGNGDGVDDSDQNTVSSLPIVESDGGGGGPATYVTLVSMKADDAPAGDPVPELAEVMSITNPAPLGELPPVPAGAETPIGFLEFAVEPPTPNPGFKTTVEVLLPPGSNANQYWKFGREPGNLTPHWYLFYYDADTDTGAEFADGKVILHLVDGGRGDDDLTANGVIQDPGVPVAAVDLGGFTPSIHLAGVDRFLEGSLNLATAPLTLTYTVETSSDFSSWETQALTYDGSAWSLEVKPTGATLESTGPSGDLGVDLLQLRDQIAVSAGGARYVRVRTTDAMGAVTVTPPMGAYGKACLSGSDTIVSQGLTKAPAIDGIAGAGRSGDDKIKPLPPHDAMGVDVYQGHYAVGIGGVGDGHFYRVLSNTATELTLETAAGEVTAFEAGQAFQVIPYWTLSEVFEVSANPAIYDSPGTSIFGRRSQVLMSNGISMGTNLSAGGIYYRNGTWKVAFDHDPGTAAHSNADSLELDPEGYLTVRHRPSDAGTLFVSYGVVPEAGLRVPVATQDGAPQDNQLGISNAASLSLADLNLRAGGAFVDSAGTSLFSRKDQLLVYDNAVASQLKVSAATYYYDSSAATWRDAKAGNAMVNPTSIHFQPGAHLVWRAASSNGFTTFWKIPNP